MPRSSGRRSTRRCSTTWPSTPSEGGAGAALLAPHADAQFGDAFPLRLLGGVHRMVLAGEAPELAAHFASAGGDGDAEAGVGAAPHAARGTPPAVLDALTRPPQTNEVGRAAALVSGLLVVAARTGLPVRIREIGSSGGLNLRLDAYWYGDGTSAEGGATRLAGAVRRPVGRRCATVRRRARDRRAARLRPGPGRRDHRRRRPHAALLRVAAAARAVHAGAGRHGPRGARCPVVIDRAEIADWVPAQARPRARDHVRGDALGGVAVPLRRHRGAVRDRARGGRRGGHARRAGGVGAARAARGDLLARRSCASTSGTATAGTRRICSRPPASTAGGWSGATCVDAGVREA